MDKVDRMSVDEILTRLRDSLAQQGRQISSVFHHYDKARNGKISRSDFRKVNIYVITVVAPDKVTAC